MVGLALAMFIALFGWGAELFRLARSGREGATRLVHQLHPRRRLRLQVEGLNSGTWRGGASR